MRRYLVTLLALLPVMALAQTWTTQNSCTNEGLNGVDFVNASTGWVAGQHGVVCRTTDGGSTWTSLTSGMSGQIANIDMVDELVGWYVGEGGMIRKTTNGGDSWFSQTSAPSFLNDLYFVDQSHGWVVGQGGTIMRTTNGGSTWESQESNTDANLFDVCFVDVNRGWIVGEMIGDEILRTTDGGTTWIHVSGVTAWWLYGVAFVDANTGWAAGGAGAIVRTTDGGLTWQAQQSNTYEILYEVAFTDANNGWICGYSGTMLHTSNGGLTWSQEQIGTGQNVYDLAFLDANSGWAVGQNGMILHRTGGGSNWSAQTSGTTNILVDVFFVNSNNGWTVGYGGVIRHTTNGGTNWTSQTSNTPADLHGVAFANTTNGCVVGESGVILRTTNGGSTWINTGHSGSNLYEVDFASSSTGWAVGGSGTILRTTNGGSSWEAQNSGTYELLSGVDFADVNNGWAAGYSGTILHTTNGGVTWVPQSSEPPEDFWGITFVDVNNGWIVGRSGVIRHTSNGGSSWTSQNSGTTSGLNEVDFVDASYGWAVGYDGIVLHTTNGGSVWMDQSMVTNDLYGVSFVDLNNGWAVGQNGTILHYAGQGGNQTPVAEAGGPYSGEVGQAITFDASGSFDPDGTITGYRWDWTNDGTWDTDWLSNPLRTYAYATGFHGQAKLEVKDNQDATDTDVADVVVFDIADSLYGYWSFDNPNDLGYDYSEHNNNWTQVIGNPTALDNGDFGKALELHAPTDHILIPLVIHEPWTEDHPTLDDPLTICAWVKPPSIHRASPRMVLSCQHVVPMWILFELIQNSEFENSQYSNNWLLGSVRQSGSLEASSQMEPHWTFLCVTLPNNETADHRVRLYVNGCEAASTDLVWPDVVPEHTAHMSIGSGFEGYSDYEGFEGLADEVRLYNRVLNPQEVSLLYTYPDLNARPVAVIDSISPHPAGVGWVIRFYGHGEDADGGIVNCEWNFDGTEWWPCESPMTHAYLAPGRYRAAFKVKDNENKWSLPCYEHVDVEAKLPIAVITSITPNPAANYQGDILVGPGHDQDEVSFDASGSYDPDPDGWISTYDWVSSIDGLIGTQCVFTRNDLTPGIHVISLTVVDNDNAESERVQATLTIVDGLVFRPSYTCPCIEHMEEDEPDYNLAKCECQSGYLSVYSESRLDFNSAEAGQYVEFDVTRETSAAVKAEFVSLGRTGGVWGAGYTHLRVLLDRPPMNTIWPPYKDYIGDFHEYHRLVGFEDFASEIDVLGVFLNYLGTFGGIIGEVEDVSSGILLLHDAIETGLIDPEALEQELHDQGGEAFNSEVTVRARPGISPNKNQLAFNTRASSGGAWAKAARFTLWKCITIEESEIDPDELVIQTLCPIDLIVEDPQGRTVSESVSEIPGATYVDLGANLEDQAYIPHPLDGEYHITVSPDSTADLADSIAVIVYHDGERFLLIANATVEDIRQAPYVFLSGEDSLLVREGYPAGQLRMISLPLQPSCPYVTDVFEDDIGPWEPFGEWLLMHWNGWYFDIYGWRCMHFPEPLKPGEAYWLWTADSVDIDVTGVLVDTTQDYVIPLERGFRDIGNPFNFPVEWHNLQVRRDGVTLPITDPRARRWILGHFWSWNGRRWSCHQDGLLVPWEGYQVRAQQNCELLVPPIPATAGGCQAHSVSDHDWQLSLSVSVDGLEVDENVIGAAEGAERGWDGMDAIKPPLPTLTIPKDSKSNATFDHIAAILSPHVALCLPHADWKTDAGDYAVDIRNATSDQETWNMEVRCDVDRGCVVTLEWVAARIPEGITLTLVDMNDNSKGFDMRTETTYSFVNTARGAVRHIQVRATGVAIPGQEQPDALPVAYCLHQNYPNPFNATTVFAFDLPEAGTVQMNVYNVVGQQAASIVSGYMAAGKHTVSFDAVSLPSGVYFYRIEANGFVDTKKMLLVK